MRYWWILPVCAVALAQTPQPARVSGVTRNAAGEPLARSTVRLAGAQTYTRTANEKGLSDFTGVAPGRYVLLAWHRGYYPQKYGASEPLLATCPTAAETGLPAAAAQIQEECLRGAPGAS